MRSEYSAENLFCLFYVHSVKACLSGIPETDRGYYKHLTDDVCKRMIRNSKGENDGKHRVQE